MRMAKKCLKSVGAAERSAYFARREAANVLRLLLKGDAQRRASASIQSLVYRPSVRNKKATFALVCQTLKYLPILKKVLADINLVSCKWKAQAELIYVITYDILFGQNVVSIGDPENFVRSRRNSLQTALARICMNENVKFPEDLLPKDNQGIGVSKPRYVRVNTLKGDIESALQTLRMTTQVKQDDLISDLLVLPAGTDLHDHPLVLNGNLFLQGKASCMSAVALSPHPEWEVLDACAAPGNKTVQLAALMNGRGKLFACELNDQRLKRLRETVELSGALNVEILHADFLKLRPDATRFSKVRAILLDPSCSGSGTALQRLDHLLPSHFAGHGKDSTELKRLNNLATFQKKALLHALSFPSVERVVYSTCSIHQIENEDVISSVLPHAHAYNFHLETPFPEWAHRGLPVFEEAKHLLRTEGTGDMEGFFIALFVRQYVKLEHQDSSANKAHIVSSRDVIETSTSHSKLVSRQKHNAHMTTGKPEKIHVEEDSLLPLPKFNVAHAKQNLPCKKIFLKATRNLCKKSILNALLRKGFGTPKMMHLLYMTTCNKKRKMKREIQKKENLSS